MSPERKYPATIDYAFAAVSCAEAEHSLYMLRTLVDRAKRDEIFSERELREWAGRLSEQVAAIRHALALAVEAK